MSDVNMGAAHVGATQCVAIAVSLTLLLAATPAAAQSDADVALARSVAELRGIVGLWDVTTEMLNADPVREVRGTYRFEWVVPDRVAIGVAEQPELESATGILFWINERAGAVEMATVGPDGRLWRMSGPLGGNERRSEPFTGTDGIEYRLRFTHEFVSDDEMHSWMHITGDGGDTWSPGNRQRFVRRAPATKRGADR